MKYCSAHEFELVLPDASLMKSLEQFFTIIDHQYQLIVTSFRPDEVIHR
jgi:hypothetical protein